MGSSAPDRGDGVGRAGVALAAIGLLGLCALIAWRAFGADETQFNRQVGWALILSLAVAAVGAALVLLDKSWRNPDHSLEDLVPMPGS